VSATILAKGCVCFFVLLNRYWGIVTVPGSFLQEGTWGDRILTLHLNYVAGHTGPLLFLFERTHNCYVDNHGLESWRLRRVDRSKVRSATLVRVLSDGKIPRGRGPRVCQSSTAHNLNKPTLFLLKKKEKKKPEGETPALVNS